MWVSIGERLWPMEREPSYSANRGAAEERQRIKKAIMGSSKTAAAMNQKRAPAVGQVPGSRRHPVVTDTGGCQLYGQGLGLANAHPSRQLQRSKPSVEFSVRWT